MSLEFNNSWDALRWVCGLFFLPHLAGKLMHPERAIGLFTEAGLKPQKLVLYLAIVLEALCAIGLILNIYARQLAMIAAVFLFVAGITVFKVTKGEWLWNRGGPDYCVFWGLCCVIVAVGN
jgi:putative oxidoreductase